MAEGTSSCRPARLLRFEDTLDAVADGLAHRRGQLADALEAYQSSCSGDYVVPTEGTVEVVRGFGSGLRDWGRWIGDVGRAFEDAATARAFTGTGSTDFEGVIVTEEDQLLGYLRDHLDPDEDPYRGIPEGLAADWASRLGFPYDQNEPPAWIKHLSQGGTAADILGPLLKSTAEALQGLPEWVSVTVVVGGGAVRVTGDSARVTSFYAELQARIRLPVGASRHVAAAARWVNGMGVALGFAAPAAVQWYADAGLPGPQRVARTATRSIAVGGGSFIGGAALGAACGPGAPVCSAVTGIVGAFGGAFAGDLLADTMPWMTPHETLPGEHNVNDIRNAVSAPDGEIEPSVAAAVDLMASDMALADSAGNPTHHDRVAALLPERDRLKSVIATGQRPEEITSTGTTTTTTTATVPMPTPHRPDIDGAPDPWVEARSYE